jgi:hypothetical protein
MRRIATGECLHASAEARIWPGSLVSGDEAVLATWKELLHEKASPAEEDSHRRHAGRRYKASLQAVALYHLEEEIQGRCRGNLHPTSGFLDPK